MPRAGIDPVIVLFNKTYSVLLQFTDKGSAGSDRKTLSAFIGVPLIYPAGRLSRDSEGLLILTGDGKLRARILNPKHKMIKTCWVQVEGVPQQSDLEWFEQGILLEDEKILPAQVRLIDPPADLWPRIPSVRFRKTVPETWLEVSLREGRNRQVRRMTVALSFPTLRLIWAQIGSWQLGRLQPSRFEKILNPTASPRD